MCESAFEELQESLAGRAGRNRSEEVGERLTPLVVLQRCG